MDFLGTLTINNGEFIGFHGIFMGFHRWYVTNHVCFWVSLQKGIQQQGLPHPMGRSYRGYTPSSHATSITLSTIYTSYLYIYYIIYIYIPSYKSPIFVGVEVPMGLRVPPFGKIPIYHAHIYIRPKYLFCLPCLCLRIGTKGCEGCLHRQEARVQNAFQGVHVRSSKSFLGISATN